MDMNTISGMLCRPAVEQPEHHGVQAPPQQQECCKQQVPRDWPHMVPAPGQVQHQRQEQAQEQGLLPPLQPHHHPAADQDANGFIQDLMALKTPANKKVRHTVCSHQLSHRHAQLQKLPQLTMCTSIGALASHR